MADPRQVNLLNEGVDAWNRGFTKMVGSQGPDLRDAQLSGRDLTGVSLSDADLQNSDLSQATLNQGAILRKANLRGANLFAASFRGADLTSVNFSEAHFERTTLRDANLECADLSAVKGWILSEQLAGADLTGAKLPDYLAKRYEDLTSVREISESARKLFLSLLAGCLYSWLTIATTRDAHLITNRVSSPLPIIQTPIPIVGFYVVAPVLLLCLYFYFHFCLQRLWEEFGSLPAVFTDGKPLYTRTDPWLLNDLVRSHVSRLKKERPFLSYFQEWLSVALVWGLVPTTMIFFWGRYLKRHEMVWTTLLVLILAIAFVAAIRLYRLAGKTLRGDPRKPFAWKEALKDSNFYLRAFSPVLIAFILMLVSLGAVYGLPRYQTAIYDTVVPRSRWNPLTWVPSIMRVAHNSPFADLTDTDDFLKPPGWKGKTDDVDQEFANIRGTNLNSMNLRYAFARDAFLPKAQLSESDLEGSTFASADLRQANLQGANLEFANLNNTLMQRAKLDGAHLEHSFAQGIQLHAAFLRDSHLESANLQYASLIDADLSRAELKDANLMDAWLNKASLDYATMTGTRLAGAHLEGARLFAADLKGAYLHGANFARASIRSADLRGTDLVNVDMGAADLRDANLADARLDQVNLSGASLVEANLRNVKFVNAYIKFSDLRHAVGLMPDMLIKGTKQWEFAFFDDNMLKQLGLPANHNEKLQELKQAEQKLSTSK
jgi:uncharacterized protein YjbI with pentapeptide repeats